MAPKIKDTNWIKRLILGIKNLPKAFFSINLSHNTGTKFFSLVLAILFWFFVMDQVDPEITKVFESVPVQLINQQELDQNNLIIMDQHDYLVDVEVTGRRNNVLDLNASSIYLWADVRNVEKGSNVLQINKTINSDAVTIQTLTPNEIVLSVDQIVSIPKQVRVFISGDFQTDLYQNGLTISPEEVKVTGPETLVNQVAYLGATLNVTNLSTDTTKEVSLVPYDNDGEMVNGITLENSYSSVSIIIGQSKTLDISTTVNGSPAEGYKVVSVNVSPTSATLSGNESTVNTLTTLASEVINLTGVETETFIVEKNLVLPEGVSSNVEDNIVQIEVQIEPEITKEFSYNISDIPVVNLSEDLVTDLSELDGAITVKVKDVESVVNEISRSDIHLSINFSIVEKEGLYRLKINVTNEDDFSEITIDPLNVEVNVTQKTD